MPKREPEKPRRPLKKANHFWTLFSSNLGSKSREVLSSSVSARLKGGTERKTHPSHKFREEREDTPRKT